MKRFPHIHRLQLHPHSEKVVSQISMVLGERIGKRDRWCVSTSHEGRLNTLENLSERCSGGCVTQVISRLSTVSDCMLLCLQWVEADLIAPDLS